MKTLKFGAIAFVLAGMVACKGEMAWKTDSSTEWYTVDVPEHFEEMYDLNSDASTQYGYVEEVGGEVKEHYLIIITETHDEIASYDLGFDFDAESYSEIAVSSLEGGLDEYEVLTKNAKVEQVNGMDCVKNSMRGSLGFVDVYYQLGVFEGETGFYQVLTWCIEDQKDEFKGDMDKIINSFKEK